MSTTESPLSLADAQAQFSNGRGYLAAASMGLPTQLTLDALTADLERWKSGTVQPQHFDAGVARTREHYARMVGVSVNRVAMGSQTSAMVSVFAASLVAGDEVICVNGDFSSIVFPFVAVQARGVKVRHVPLAELAGAITPSTTLVVFSHVQSATGCVADIPVILAAAAANDARTICDTTQSAGAMPVDASLFDATVCHNYKWLCSPRGTAFMTLSERYQAELTPIQANWVSGEDPWASCYGPEFRPTSDARVFDVSPAWQAWVGTEPVINMFSRLDLAEVNRHNVALGDALCDGLGVERLGQAIVGWPDSEGCDLGCLEAAGITASGRAGRARVAFHLWNDEEDVANVLKALGR